MHWLYINWMLWSPIYYLVGDHHSCQWCDGKGNWQWYRPGGKETACTLFSVQTTQAIHTLNEKLQYLWEESSEAYSWVLTIVAHLQSCLYVPDNNVVYFIYTVKSVQFLMPQTYAYVTCQHKIMHLYTCWLGSYSIWWVHGCGCNSWLQGLCI